MGEILVDSYAGSANKYGIQSLYGGNRQEVTQSVTGKAVNVTKATFNLYKAGGSPTGNAYAKIYAHSGTFGTSSIPTGAALATSNAVDVSGFSGSPSAITFNFSGANQILLTNAVKYILAIVFAGGDASNYIRCQGDYSPDAIHAGNESYSNDGSTFNAENVKDMVFSLYGNEASGAPIFVPKIILL